MLNLFSATAHFQYAKSLRLYLQLMDELPIDFPWLYKLFQQGYYTIRRSDQFWAGLWTDLAIEQSLMRTAKSRGGLTRGRGMTEPVRLFWVLLGHKCAEVHEAMTEPSGSKYTTSEQHVELGTSRKSRDFIDLVKIIQWLLTFNPFVLTNSNLRSLQSGLSSSKEKDGVNCEDAETIGANIQTKLDNKAFNDIYFKKSNCVLLLWWHCKKVLNVKTKLYISTPSNCSRD